MKHITLNQIFKAFEMMNRCYEGEGGASGDIISNTNVVEDTVVVEEIPFDSTSYMGDEKVNPGKLPLKDFDRTGKTKGEIDSFIKAAGASIFLTKDGIAKKEAEKVAKEKEGKFEARKEVTYKKDKDTEDQKAVIEKVNEDGSYNIKVGDEVIENVTKETLSAIKTKEEDALETDDKEVKEFYEKSGLTPVEFNSLSEKAQNTLFEKIFTETEEAGTSLQEEHTQLKTDYDTLLEDPVIAARVQDITSGSNYVAAKIDPISDQEISKLDSAFEGDKPFDAVRKIVQDIFDKRVAAAVKKERGFHDLKAKQSSEMEAAFKVFKKVGDLDKRLAVKETDYKKLKRGHPEFNTEKGLGEFATYLTKRGYSAKQISEHTAEELYASFAKNKGWDKERDKTIFKSGKAELLKKIKDPRLLEKAKSLKQGKKTTTPGSLQGASGVDYNTLKQELVDGNDKNYLRLLKAHEHNSKVRGVLSQIQYDASVERDNRKKKE